jgi:hypothetical protein
MTLTANAKAGLIIQPQSNWGYQIKSYMPVGQTFTAEDALINSIGFHVSEMNPHFPLAPIWVDLFKGVGTGGTLLGRAQLDGIELGYSGFYDADFNSVTLTVGQVYTATLSSSTERAAIRGTYFEPPPGPYAGGKAIFRGVPDPNRDLAFRVQPIPGPTTFLRLAHFVARWLDNGCSNANDWCWCADINRDKRVDFMDYSWLTWYVSGIAPETGVARNPDPNDTATEVSVSADLSWTPGSHAAAHGVYFGTNPIPDANDFQGYQTATTFDPGTMVAYSTYYWQVDEVGLGGETTGEVWSFTTASAPGEVANPIPADGASILGEVYPVTGAIYTILGFTAGVGAVSHEAFFSDNIAKVIARDTNVSLGAPPFHRPLKYFVGHPLFPPAIDSLVRGMTYYWCVDETDGNGVVWRGQVWSFSILIYP